MRLWLFVQIFQVDGDNGVWDWLPQQLPGLGVAALVLAGTIRLFMMLNKNVLDRQTQAISEYVMERKSLMAEIEELRRRETNKNRRIYQLERALASGGLDIPPEPEVRI